MVTFAPRFEVPVTSSEVALVTAAFKSKLPVINTAPTAVLLPIVLPNCTVASELLLSVPLVSTVKSCAPLTMLEKVTALPAVVKVLAAPDKVTAPV